MSTGNKGWFKNLPDDELLRLASKRLDDCQQINASIELLKMELKKQQARYKKKYYLFREVEFWIKARKLDK